MSFFVALDSIPFAISTSSPRHTKLPIASSFFRVRQLNRRMAPSRRAYMYLQVPPPEAYDCTLNAVMSSRQ